MGEGDLEALRQMAEEASLDAVGCDSKAAFCWARGEPEAAQDQEALSLMYQNRARALHQALALLDGTGDLDPEVRPAEPEPRRPRLTLIQNPEKIA
jgi:hypothetical protein